MGVYSLVRNKWIISKKVIIEVGLEDASRFLLKKTQEMSTMAATVTATK